MTAANKRICKKSFTISALLFLSIWLFAPAALAIVPGQGQGPTPKQIDAMKQADAAYQFTAGLQTPPPLNSSCQSGKAEGQCMNDYCGTDVQDIVTACLSTQFATKNISSLKSKCWKGYACTGAKGVCCVIPKEIAGECNHDYEGADWGQVSFKCTPTEQECISKYPGGVFTGGSFGCSLGICCKVPKSVAQLSQNSECNFDYSGPDKLSVHFKCTDSDELCKTQNGTPSGKGKGCQNTGNTCCRLSGANKEYNAKIRRDIPINTFCFTAKECADASGDVGNFKAGQGCTKRGAEVQGECIAPEPDYDLQYPIFGVKSIRGLKNFIALLFNTGIGIIVVASAIFFIWGAFKYMVSAVGAEITTAKSTMIDSLVGLALGMGAFAILANINPNTLNFKSYEIKMINRLSFYNLKYCPEIYQSGMKFMDAGPPDDPKDFQAEFSSKGYGLSLDQTKCGNEYFIEGSDATNVCTGSTCGQGKTCMSCSTGIVDDAQCKGLSTNRMNGCTSNDKVQVFGRVLLGDTHSVDGIQATLYCFKANGQTIDDSKTVDISDKEAIKIENVKTANTGGSVGTFLINSMTEDGIKKAVQECKDAGFDFGRIALLLDLKRPGEDVTRRFILTKAHCNTNIGASAQDSGAVLYYAPFAITGTCGEGFLSSKVFQSLAQTLVGGAKCSPNFKSNYLENTWSTAEFIEAANHLRIIECPITAADFITVPNWLQNIAAVGGIKLVSGF
ncbi:MAG: pilin [Patescibacteria group bacterium]